jgi:hypothetical protein
MRHRRTSRRSRVLSLSDLRYYYTRSKGILCQGTGSAAHSAVCYVLGSTHPSLKPAVAGRKRVQVINFGGCAQDQCRGPRQRRPPDRAATHGQRNLGSAYGSQGKAVASAAFGRPSGALTERADQPTPRGIAAASGGHIMGQGAVPIVRNGIVEGACGVGGGTSQQDEDCARAGVAQL